MATALLFTLVGCGTTPVGRAPVEDRGAYSSKNVNVAPVAKSAPGFENAGKPGYYTVKPGDTLIHIALESGQSYKDVARWNTLENPNKIEVGQVLRVVPPVAAPAEPVAVAKPVSSSTVAPVAVTAAGSAANANKTTPPASAASTAATKPAAAANTASEDDLPWAWPTAKGAVIADFDEAKNKGLDIGGAAGEPVLAAADGKVVYANSGLRGYGNLIILKHNNVYLSAYAHNQTLLVKEDQVVKKGQKIAEMGKSDSEKIKLHFEIRKLGKPVDPAKYLPAR